MHAPITLQKSKHAARVGNVYFLAPVGVSLQWATHGIGREDLPPDVQDLLDRLGRRDTIGEMDDPVACEARLAHPANDRSATA
jgi:hypothetical protein